MDTAREWDRIIGGLVAAARKLKARFRPPKPEPLCPWPKLAPPLPVPADPAEHAVQFAEVWYDRLEFHARRRMRELGIVEPRIGAYDIDHDFRHAAFHP